MGNPKEVDLCSFEGLEVNVNILKQREYGCFNDIPIFAWIFSDMLIFYPLQIDYKQIMWLVYEIQFNPIQPPLNHHQILFNHHFTWRKSHEIDLIQHPHDRFVTKVLAHHELHSSLVALLRLLLHRGEAHGEARPDMGEERRDVIL